jgi:hypothetical protein
MIDTGTVVTIALSGVGAISTVGAWAVRTYVKGEVGAVDQKLEVHSAEDRLMHTHIKEALTRIEKKLDDREDERAERDHRRGRD